MKGCRAILGRGHLTDGRYKQALCGRCRAGGYKEVGSRVGEGVPVTEAAGQGGLHEAPFHTMAGPVFGGVQPDVAYACACMHIVQNQS